MKTETDNQKIIAYLLGDLPEAETEIFDERSFTDDAFAERLTAAENDLIDGYIQGDLSGESLKKFESVYLATPLRRQKVEFAKSLQTIAGREQIETQPKQETVGFFSFLKNYRLQISLAFGALAVLILGVWFFTTRRISPEIVVQNTPTPSPQNQTNVEKEREVAVIDSNANFPVNNNDLPQNKEPVNENRTPANKNPNNENTVQPKERPTVTPPKITLASIVLAPALRNNQLKTFPISKDITDVAVRLELESDDFPLYRVALSDEAGNNLRQFANLRTRRNSLNVRVPAKSLKSGIYTFEVSGIKDDAAEIISSYTFRLVVK